VSTVNTTRNPAATIVKSLSIASDVPSMTLTRTADYNGTGMFNAGMGYKLEDADNKVTVAVAGLTLPTPAAIVDVTAPTGFVMHSSHVALGQVSLTSATVSSQYDFAPKTINTFYGAFNAAAQFVNANEDLSPIQSLTATSATVYGNSVPELYLDKSKLTFVENMTSQNVRIWGINIPLPDQGDLRYVGGFMDDQDDSAEAAAGVENNFSVGALGVIANDPSNYLRVNFAQFLNNVDVNVAKYLKISRRYWIDNAIKGTTDFTGREFASFTNPTDNLVAFPQVLVVGDIAAVWFEYEGTEGTPSKMVGDISTAFYAPYDETLLPEQQAVMSPTTNTCGNGTKLSLSNEADSLPVKS
jgi:hypothetical protein